MLNYVSLLRLIMDKGDFRVDRTGVGTKAIFGSRLTWNLQDGFPAVTTKKLYFKSVAAELAGFLEGTTSAARMRELGTNIWDANVNAPHWQNNPNCRGKDDMGKIYGALWRDFNEVDQLQEMIWKLEEDRSNRRMVVSAWDPSLRLKQCLPPCHIFFQFFVRENKFLDCQWYIRSADAFLGLPFDIASYALLTHIMAQQVKLKPGLLIMVSGDTHIYINHIEQVKEQLKRVPYKAPTLDLWDGATINNFHPDMAKLENYAYHPSIPAPMAV